MTYKELLEKLQQLDVVQLCKEVVYIPEEGEGFRINDLEILEEPLYCNPEEPEDGCFPLPIGDDPELYELAYPAGYPLLN